MTDYLAKVGVREIALSLDEMKTLDTYQKEPNKIHILHKKKSFHLELVEEDFNHKIIKILVNGNTYQVSLAGPYEQLAKDIGLFKEANQKMKDVKAPMPGLIVDVLVKADESFAKGDSLVILSAMKMENIIKATGNGIVKRISVSQKDSVEKGQLLIEIA